MVGVGNGRWCFLLLRVGWSEKFFVGCSVEEKGKLAGSEAHHVSKTSK